MQDIKARLARLDKSQTKLLKALHRRGFPRLSYVMLNDYINEKRLGKQGDEVLKESDRIISEWENQESA